MPPPFLFPPSQELLQLEDRLGSVNRGAVQTTIERFTFPHKYKKVKGFLEAESVKGGRLQLKSGAAKGKQALCKIK